MKRFYETVSLEPVADGDDVRLLLDGRSVKTPSGAEICVPVGGFAVALAVEWEAQAEAIDPSSMPLTRLANAVIDGVSQRRMDVAADIIAYGNSDLICYWADGPGGLVARQEEHWRPVLTWAQDHLRAEFITVTGVVPIVQDRNAIMELAIDVNKLSNYGLAALHEMTTLTGSVLIGLMVLRGALSAEAGWDAAHVDEAFQVDQWGDDEEATARMAGRKAAFLSAVRALELLGILRST